MRGEGPGQPGPQHQHPQQPHPPAQPQLHRRRRRGPAAEWRDAARRVAWLNPQQVAKRPAAPVALPLEVKAGPALGSGETSWNRQKIGAEPDLVAFHI